MEERDCPRCGALLPDAEEGVCQTCGYEYGRATLFMPALHPVPSEDIPAPDDDAPAPPRAATAAAAPDPQRGKLVTVLVVLVGLLLLALVALVLLYFSQQSGAPT